MAVSEFESVSRLRRIAFTCSVALLATLPDGPANYTIVTTFTGCLTAVPQPGCLMAAR